MRISAIGNRPAKGNWQQGFTLLETVIALTLFGVTAMVAYHVMGSSTARLADQESRLFAGWAAANALETRLLGLIVLQPGFQEEEAELAGRRFHISVSIESLELPLYHVTVTARQAGMPLAPEVTLDTLAAVP